MNSPAKLGGPSHRSPTPGGAVGRRRVRARVSHQRRAFHAHNHKHAYTHPWTSHWQSFLLLNPEGDSIITSPCDTLAACSLVAPGTSVPPTAFAFIVDALLSIGRGELEASAHTPQGPQLEAFAHRGNAALQCGVQLLRCAMRNRGNGKVQTVSPGTVPLVEVGFSVLSKVCANAGSARAYRYFLQFLREALVASEVQGGEAERLLVTRLMWQRSDTGFAQRVHRLSPARARHTKRARCDGGHLTVRCVDEATLQLRMRLIIRPVPVLLRGVADAQNAAVASTLMALLDAVARVHGGPCARRAVTDVANGIPQTDVKVTFLRLIASHRLRAAVVWDLVRPLFARVLNQQLQTDSTASLLAQLPELDLSNDVAAVEAAGTTGPHSPNMRLPCLRFIGTLFLPTRYSALVAQSTDFIPLMSVVFGVVAEAVSCLPPGARDADVATGRTAVGLAAHKAESSSQLPRHGPVGDTFMDQVISTCLNVLPGRDGYERCCVRALLSLHSMLATGKPLVPAPSATPQ